MSITSYYGESDLQTFLDYGERSKDGSVRTVQRHLEGQEAYDQWHLALYMKDYLRCLAVSRQPVISFTEIPRPDKNVLGYLLAKSIPDLTSVCELGSTLFEVIEGFACTQRWMEGVRPEPQPNDQQDLDWLGVEISTVFSEAAELLHPHQRLSHFLSAGEVTTPISLLLDRSVSNYCFQTSADFASVVGRSSASLLNSYFSLGETFASSRYAKQLNYFSLEEFVEECAFPLFHLYGLTAPRPIGDQDLSRGRPVVEGFWYAGPVEILETFTRTVDTLPEVKAFLNSKDFAITPAKEMLSARRGD